MMGFSIPPVNIGGVMVGDGFPPVFMAEIGTFFNQDVDLACSYVEAVAKAGAPILKSEVLHDPDVCLPDSGLDIRYTHAGGTRTENYRSLIERKCLSLEDYRRIFGFASRLGVPFVASVYDRAGIDFLTDIGVAAIKIARDSVNHVPLIRHAARTGRPLIFDAGLVYLDEVSRAVRLAQDEGAAGVIVNHHPGFNPARPDVHHMRLMQNYKEALGVPVGLACHYRGEEILYLAVGLGVNLIEKGVADDPDRVEQDLVSAAPLSEVSAIIRKIQNCWEALGDPRHRPDEPRDLARRKGIVTSRPVPAGEVLGPDNLSWAWPPLGVSVEHWDLVCGRRAARRLDRLEAIRWADLAGEAEVRP